MVDLDYLWWVVYRDVAMLEASDRSSGKIHRLSVEEARELEIGHDHWPK